jgi:Ca2+-binding RTX toxin-like protein
LFAALATIPAAALAAAVSVPAVSGATTTIPRLAARQALVQGTDGPDRIITQRRAQRVLALAGNDYVLLGKGDDTAFGEGGDDWLQGNTGTDHVYGGPGNDHPQGGTGNDLVSGGSGDDELDGGPGRDRLYAGAGNDEVTGDEGDDVIYPGPGADLVFGEEGMNKIVAADDGVRDDLYCNQIHVGAPPGLLVYHGRRDPLDNVRNCRVVVRP